MNVMKVVGIGCLGCLGLVVVLGVVGFMLLPDGYQVSRSIEIAAPPATVFPLVDTPHRWPEWDPWTHIDPSMTNEFSGPESGVGAKGTWTSQNDEVGSGSFTIVESVPNQRVVMDLDVPGVDMTPRGTLTFEPTPLGTRVTWTNEDELSGGYRVFGLAAEALLGPMVETGLRDLKEIAEREASADDQVEKPLGESNEPVEPLDYLPDDGRDEADY